MAKITVLDLRMSTREGSLKAFCNVDLKGVILIYGCRLMDGKNGLWVGMPQRKDESGEKTKWWDIVKIQKDTLKEEIQTAVIAAYEKSTGSPPAASSSEGSDTEF